MQLPSASTARGSWLSLEDLVREDEPVDPDPKVYPNMDKLWPSWHRQAKCLGKPDDSLFFGAPKDGAYRSSAIREAKEFCADCPVFKECLRHALTQREPYGIWAATTMRERSVIYDGIDSGVFTLEEIIEDRLEEIDVLRRNHSAKAEK